MFSDGSVISIVLCSALLLWRRGSKKLTRSRTAVLAVLLYHCYYDCCCCYDCCCYYDCCCCYDCVCYYYYSPIVSSFLPMQIH